MESTAKTSGQMRPPLLAQLDQLQAIFGVFAVVPALSRVFPSPRSEKTVE
jgi:hypothetical protein